ncbi:bone morphogenetic protein 2 [Chrysoperla carnea]|uniref:bone morphogenetic protein 2 n=1 Tax=Chrysoperla carnea TaxID=189513 RepID=UPI001D082FBE|nr:bone morphogenetic protein 2 [Chrysoperla carnea]
MPRTSSIRWRKLLTICPKTNVHLITTLLIIFSTLTPCLTQDDTSSSDMAGNLNPRNSRSFQNSDSTSNQNRDTYSQKYVYSAVDGTSSTSSDSNNGISRCTTCMKRKELEKHIIESLKREMLMKMGMQEEPNITTLPQMTPARMQEVIKKFGFDMDQGMQGDDPNAYMQQNGGYGDMWSEGKQLWKEGIKVHEEGDDFHAKTEKMIVWAQPFRLRHGWKEHNVLIFRFSDKTLRHPVKEAILNVWVNPPSRNHHRKKRTPSPTKSKHNETVPNNHKHSENILKRSKRSKSTDNDNKFGDEHSRPVINKENDYISVIPTSVFPPLDIEEPETITVSVYKVHKNQKNPETPSFELIASENVLRSHLKGDGKWIPLDISPMLSSWFKAPRENWGFVVRAEDENGVGFDVQHCKSEDDSKVPYVELYTVDVSQKRKKRSYGLDCTENSDETRCCRYPLTVDFQEFGWDWIIAPKQYRANYCSGECGYVFLQKFPHTHIASLASPTQPDTKPAVEACCAPRKMSPISMLYFDHELNIIYGTLPNMVVDRCGCS